MTSFEVSLWDHRNRQVKVVFISGSGGSAGDDFHYRYDPQNRQYAYDLAGNLTQVIDANNGVTTFQFDKLNRKTREILPPAQKLLFSD